MIGDSGTADANAGRVRDAFLEYSREAPANLWLMLGDNAYGSGTDAEYQRAVFDFYPSVLRSTWLWPALGNHDGLVQGNEDAQRSIEDIATGCTKLPATEAPSCESSHGRGFFVRPPSDDRTRGVVAHSMALPLR